MEPIQKNEPLVSVIIITYNSAKYVLETLESIKDQTYKKIELIVSDDGSTDNTIDNCKVWLNHNKKYFVRTKLVSVEKNTGIPANCNRGINAAKGEWIKIIAADDLLHKHCIKSNIAFVSKNTNAKVVFSKRIAFTGDSSKMQVIAISKPSLFNDCNISSYQQYRLALRRVSCPPNTIFYHKEVFIQVKGFDEQFPLYEDWPMLLKVTKQGFRFYYMDEETVFYRIHHESVYHSGTKTFIYREWDLKTWDPAYIKYVLPNVGFDEKVNFYYRYLIKRLFFYTPLNTRNVFTRILNRILLTLPNYHNKLIRYLLFNRIRSTKG